MWDNSLLDLFNKGGIVMWPLLLCSIVGLAIVIEKVIVFTQIGIDFDKFVSKLEKLVRSKRYNDAKSLCKQSNSPVADISLLYLEHIDADHVARENVLQREGSLRLEKIEKHLPLLAVVANLSPLLGLLGTVTGLVAAFHQIELSSGVVQPSDLASGIWEALITTIFGLVIAIPALAAYHAFEHRADENSRRMQLMVSYLDEWCGKKTIPAAQELPADEMNGKLIK